MRALAINVYRTNALADSTNGGISSRYDRLLVVCSDGNYIIDTESPLPENLVKVVKREFPAGNFIYHLEPVARPTGAGWMAGGNYGASCDSRFSMLADGFYGALPIHDRQESWKLYNEMR